MPAEQLALEMTAAFDFTFHGAAGPDTQSGEVVIPVTQLDERLRNWLEVNPRDPVSTALTKAMRDTLMNSPEKFYRLNLGIYLRVAKATIRGRKVTLTLTNPKIHGVVNGGNTLATCLKVFQEMKEAGRLADLEKAFVSLNILCGLDSEEAALEESTALNSSREVKQEDLLNQQDYFKPIKDAMKGEKGEDSIRYFEGQEGGEVPIKYVVQTFNLFNLDRLPLGEYPKEYSRPKQGLSVYADEKDSNFKAIKLVASKLPEILRLKDSIEKRIPKLWGPGSTFVREIKSVPPTDEDARKQHKKRVGSYPLHFLGEEMAVRVDFGIVYPILSAFRANVVWDSKTGTFEWKVDPNELIEDVLPQLVAEYRAAFKTQKKRNSRPFNMLARDDKSFLKLLEKIVESKVNSLVPA